MVHVQKVVALQYYQLNKSKNWEKNKSKTTHPQKFAPNLALKWYPQDLIGLSEVV